MAHAEGGDSRRASARLRTTNMIDTAVFKTSRRLDPRTRPLDGQWPLGIPTLRDRVCVTAAMLVMKSIFEADLPPELYAVPGETPNRRWSKWKTAVSRPSGSCGCRPQGSPQEGPEFKRKPPFHCVHEISFTARNSSRRTHGGRRLRAARQANSD